MKISGLYSNSSTLSCDSDRPNWETNVWAKPVSWIIITCDVQRKKNNGDVPSHSLSTHATYYRSIHLPIYLDEGGVAQERRMPLTTTILMCSLNEKRERQTCKSNLIKLYRQPLADIHKYIHTYILHCNTWCYVFYRLCLLSPHTAHTSTPPSLPFQLRCLFYTSSDDVSSSNYISFLHHRWPCSTSRIAFQNLGLNRLKRWRFPSKYYRI